MADDNVTTLELKKVLDGRNLSGEYRDKINSLTTAEVNQLIKLAEKLGPFTGGSGGGGNPWIL